MDNRGRLVCVDDNGDMWFNTAFAPPQVAFNVAFQEQALRAVKAEMMACQLTGDDLWKHIEAFGKRFIVERAFPGFRGIDKVLDAGLQVVQLAPIGFKAVDVDKVEFNYAGEQVEQFMTDIFSRAVTDVSIDSVSGQLIGYSVEMEAEITAFCDFVSQKIVWADPAIPGGVSPTVVEVRSTFNLAVLTYHKQEEESANG